MDAYGDHDVKRGHRIKVRAVVCPDIKDEGPQVLLRYDLFEFYLKAKNKLQTGYQASVNNARLIADQV
jgi:hypothetical protein